MMPVSARYKLTTLLLSIAFIAGCHRLDDPPVPDKSINFSACVVGPSVTTFDIVTFNVENFPKGGYESIVVLADLIGDMDADIIALQEVASQVDFNQLDDLLKEYKGIYYPIDNDDWNLAYLYKTAEVNISSYDTKILFEGDWSAFPRPPFEIHAFHSTTGITAVIINNHLKCCSGADNESRRRSASDQLHQYADENYQDIPVIILGDLNDEITGTTEFDNVFWSFVNDPENFRFADMEIALASAAWWSYPSWPSHIDHIIISDELFPRLDEARVFMPDACYSFYPDVISDHRPVYISLK